MKESTARSGKIDAKVIGLGAALVIALGGVYISWRLSNPPARPPVSVPAEERQSVQDGEVDRLLASVEARLQQDAAVIATDWPSAAAPVVVARAAEVKSEAVLKLRGVVQGEQFMAFINDSTVGVGETVAGYTVESIQAESVTVVDGRGRKQVLLLYENP